MSDPLPLLARAGESAFEGCILLDISGVGTQRGMAPSRLASLRSAYPGRLLWGGGVSSVRDLFLLDEHGYDGAIIATAVHTGKVPLEMIRRGHLC
jgi:phosphoribosylformimino-5-aminoimidazole carboxamide ribotide isomerase